MLAVTYLHFDNIARVADGYGVSRRHGGWGLLVVRELLNAGASIGSHGDATHHLKCVGWWSAPSRYIRYSNEAQGL